MPGTPAEGSIPEDVRERVLAAAYDELIRWGMDRFSIVALADRHGLDPAEIRRHWGTEERLVIDVLLYWPGNQGLKPPDSGSLRDDLLLLALGMCSYVQS